MPTYAAGNLICFQKEVEPEVQAMAPRFPPLLAVVWYDAEKDQLRLEPISWPAAAALASDDLASIAAHLAKQTAARQAKSEAQEA